MTGENPLGNGKHGILLFMSQRNIIGGIKHGAANIVSCNGSNGITVMGPNPQKPDWRRHVVAKDGKSVICVNADNSSDGICEVGYNFICGNIVGTNQYQNVDFSNSNAGIMISHAKHNFLAGNVCYLNSRFGILITGETSQGNIVIANKKSILSIRNNT